MFNLLTDELPVSVVVDGAEYAINWDAKTMIGISVLIENTHVPPGDDEGYTRLAIEQLRLFYPVIPANIHGAMARLIEFYTYSNGNDDRPKSGGKEPHEKRSYSFQHDADMIYAAFLQQYPSKRIDQLHWFEFKAMLESLTEDCLFVRVMQYRSMKITSNMSKSEKQFYRRMKRIYALPDNRPQEQKDKDFADMLFYL